MDTKWKPEMLEKAALLAELEIEPSDKDLLMKNMQEMMGFMEKMNELDTTGVTPACYEDETAMILREDVVSNGDERDKILANAPNVLDYQFQVPGTF